MNLGFRAKDVVTGFEGTITGQLRYLTGCDQLLITADAKDGKPGEGIWYDVTRVQILSDKAIELPKPAIHSTPVLPG